MGSKKHSPNRGEKNGGANTYVASSKGAPRNQTVTQRSGHSLERKKEQADTELSASAGSAVQRASSDAVARRGVGKPFERFPHALFSFGGSTPFPFLKEKRKWGRKTQADEYPQGAGRICNAPSSRTAALGIGPYRVRV